MKQKPAHPAVKRMARFIRINQKDNVGVALEALKKGETAWA